MTFQTPAIAVLACSLLTACVSIPAAAPAHDAAAQADAGNLPIARQADAAVAVVDQFAAAIKAGDRERAGALLAEDVLILESGKAQRSRAEYLGGHAVNDAAFLKDAQIRITQRSARVEDDLAWVATESELQVTQDGKPMTRLSSETMVLKNTAAGWRIVHIHWSSRPKP